MRTISKYENLIFIQYILLIFKFYNYTIYYTDKLPSSQVTLVFKKYKVVNSK